MSYISVVIHKQSDWLVQRQSDKLFNLQKTQTANPYQRFKDLVLFQRHLHVRIYDKEHLKISTVR